MAILFGTVANTARLLATSSKRERLQPVVVQVEKIEGLFGKWISKWCTSSTLDDDLKEVINSWTSKHTPIVDELCRDAYIDLASIAVDLVTSLMMRPADVAKALEPFCTAREPRYYGGVLRMILGKYRDLARYPACM